MSVEVIRLCEHCGSSFRNESHYNKHIESKICFPDSSSSSRPPVSAKHSSSSKLGKKPPSSKEPEKLGAVASFWKQREEQQKLNASAKPSLLPSLLPKLLPKLHQGTGRPSSAKPHHSLPKTPDKIEQALQTLGLDKSTFNIKILNKAWRELAMEFHPDKHPGDKDKEEEFKKINKAHKQLLKWLEKERREGGSTRRNRQKYFKTKKTQTHRHTKHHRKTHRGRI